MYMVGYMGNLGVDPGIMVKLNLPTDLACHKASIMSIWHIAQEGENRKVLTMLGRGIGRRKRRRF